MKKITLLSAVFGMALSAQAATTTTTTATTTTTTTSSSTVALPLGITAIGYDNVLGHVTARIGLSPNNAVDVGVALNFNNAATTDKLQVGLSGFYLLKLQDWGMVDNYLVGGGNIKIFSDSDFGLDLFAGLQPELTLMDRLIFSVRFGVNVPIRPDFALQTAGQPISLVNGINFKVIW